MRRVMHINHELVGEVDFHRGQRIVFAGVLHKHITIRRSVGPINACGVNLWAAHTIKHMNVHGCQIGWVCGIFWQNIFGDNGCRRTPCGVKNNIADVAFQRWGWPV